MAYARDMPAPTPLPAPLLAPAIHLAPVIRIIGRHTASFKICLLTYHLRLSVMSMLL